MKTIHKIFLALLTLLISSLFAMAQTGSEPEMADLLRSNGKIYVVVAVLLIILAGLFFFLIMIDRKVSRLEKKSKENS